MVIIGIDTNIIVIIIYVIAFNCNYILVLVKKLSEIFFSFDAISLIL